MSETEGGTDFFSIGEASERTDLPESTIRYYDREFSDYLSIERGNNNERLFNDDALKELEYIRYLIKRENLSIDEVKERLDKEEEYMQRKQKNETEQDPGDDGSSDTDESFASFTPSGSSPSAQDSEEWESMARAIRQLEDRLESIEQNQQKILELLDMNLQRYNKLVEDL